MQLDRTLWVLVCAACLAGLASAATSQHILRKRMYYPSEDTEQYDPKVKKPFCNAFTGCGKKRSDNMASLVEVSEPAVEDLSRQILSEAKLWEAIQEARLELNNRNHRQQQEEEEEARVHPMPLTPSSHKRSHYYYT